MDAPLILVLIDTVLSERSIGPDISNSFLFVDPNTQGSQAFDHRVNVVTFRNPLNMVIPSTNAR